MIDTNTLEAMVEAHRNAIDSALRFGDETNTTEKVREMGMRAALQALSDAGLVIEDKMALEELREGMGHLLRQSSAVMELTEGLTFEEGPYLDRAIKSRLVWQDWLDKHEHVIDALAQDKGEEDNDSH